MKSHPFDRISFTFGLVAVAAGLVIASQQAGWWSPRPQLLVALAVAGGLACLAAMWPRSLGRRMNGIVTPTPGAAINRIPAEAAEPVTTPVSAAMPVSATTTEPIDFVELDTAKEQTLSLDAD